MKTEFRDVSDTRKNLVVEIPSTVVDAEIDKVSKDYSKAARIPGFRPGKVPTKVVRQRFRDQILHDVAHGLIPRAVEEALRERGVEPVDTPDIRDVVVEEGQPLKFTATFETVPPIDTGDYAAIVLRKKDVSVGDEAVEQALSQLRDRSARYEPVEDRGVEVGDSVILDLERTAVGESGESQTDRHENVTVDIGAPANPPGFDEALTGLHAEETKSFDVQYPDDYTIKELAGTTVRYVAALKAVRKRVVPALDDEFAKDVGEFESLAGLRDRIRADLEEEARDTARRQVRADLFRQLASRITFELPASLVEKEMDRRLEEFARQLMSQNVDPRQAGIDWAQFREAQREPARSAVASALVLDEIARRERLAAGREDVDKEIERFATRAGRTPAAIRAQLEKEGGISRLYAGLRREKAVDLALARAKMTNEPATDVPAHR